MTELTPDLCVIGAGSAGLSMAAAARTVGLSVVLIERHRMGGECLNTGCVPSKALLSIARKVHAARLATGEATDFAAVMRHVHGAIATIAPHDSEERFIGLGVTVIRAAAEFLDADSLKAGDSIIRPKKILIATGSRPFIPDIAGLGEVSVLTNESLFDIEALPRHLVILGAGAIGMEMAQAFSRLGAKVTVIARSRPLSTISSDAADIVVNRLAAGGVDFKTHTSLREVRKTDDGLRLTLSGPMGEEILEASALLVASGRQPVVEGLKLERAGVAVSPTGIVTNAALRTTNRRIYAAGDVTGRANFTHWASYQAGLILRRMLTHWPHRPNPALLVSAIYTDPEIARLGLSEADARRQGHSVQVIKVPFSGNDRAIAEGETDGFLSLVTGRRGRILGAEMVGPEAGELIAPLALAMSCGLRLKHLAATVLPYPTRAEILRKAAFEGLKLQLGSPILGWVFALARRWI